MGFDSCSIGAHKKNNNTNNLDELALKFAKEVGVRPRPIESSSETDSRGVFVRQANQLITPFGEKEDELPIEKGRYKIYWKHGCHWSNRPLIVRDILGLEDVFDDITTGPLGKGVYGHAFPDQKDYKDPSTGFYFLSQAYENAQPGFKGRPTTPTIVDLKTKKAVNNDYHRLSNYLEVQFRKFQKTDAPDLYPVKYRKEIDEFNDWLFPTINNARYRMWFATSWEAYNEGYIDFHDSLEKLDKRLETNRFLFGDYVTDSDIRLYLSLVRWETTYPHTVGPQKKRISEYKNIWEYTKDLFSIPEFKRYTWFEFPKAEDGERVEDSFFEKIAAKIPWEKLWASDGSRKKLSNDPDNIYLRHPKDETIEDYVKDISVSKWNSKEQKDRDPRNVTISVDPSINPLKGLLKNN